jgi:4a-hydroxytetrahydrobiopterin dehydratase
MDGIKFVNKMAELAETSNHHPDITIGWCRIDVTIFSHDMGGVTTKCVNLATSIDLIYE